MTALAAVPDPTPARGDRFAAFLADRDTDRVAAYARHYPAQDAPHGLATVVQMAGYFGEVGLVWVCVCGEESHSLHRDHIDAVRYHRDHADHPDEAHG